MLSFLVFIRSKVWPSLVLPGFSMYVYRLQRELAEEALKLHTWEYCCQSFCACIPVSIFPLGTNDSLFTIKSCARAAFGMVV